MLWPKKNFSPSLFLGWTSFPPRFLSFFLLLLFLFTRRQIVILFVWSSSQDIFITVVDPIFSFRWQPVNILSSDDEFSIKVFILRGKKDFERRRIG